MRLSHVLRNAQHPTWPLTAPLCVSPCAIHARDGYATTRIDMGGDHGTHMDSPAHFFAGMRTCDQISEVELLSRAVVVDAREACRSNADYELSVDDLLAWESRHGRIPSGSLVCMHTGWCERFSDVVAYRNANGSEPHPGYPGGTMHFPGFSAGAAQFLVTQRDIHGIGIDTLSLDPGRSVDFPVHSIVLRANKYQMENLNLVGVPEHGAVVLCAPLAVQGLPEAPTQVFAFVP